ncbi:MAG: Uma2 family endonuclease [Rhizobacter sp.]|nr:Uma2 family endonuclease [Chlorobiales bacterium]
MNGESSMSEVKQLQETDAEAADAALAARHQLFPFEQKEMQSNLHYTVCSEFTTMLRAQFKDDADANIGGDQAFYWNAKDDRDVICPDVYLVRGIGNGLRSSIKFWEEEKMSMRFVLEVWSKSNSAAERYEKYERYAELGVSEYAELDTERSELTGHRLNERGRYTVIQPQDGKVFFAELGLSVVYENDLLRLYRNDEKVLTASESAAEIVRLKNLLEAKK